MKLTGYSNNKKFFKFYDSKIINYEKIYEVLTGRIAGCIFREAISPEACKIIAKNFWKHEKLNSRKDGVPGFYIGTYHYKKSIDEYLTESIAANEILPSLFDGTPNMFDEVMTELAMILKLNKNQPIIRPAQHNGIESCKFFMRAWKGNGEFALAPHDDSAQCTSKMQEGFEIQQVINNPIVAINMCIENEGNSKLHYWDIQPDRHSQQQLGLEEVGYPYPVELLQDFEKIELQINSGDIYFFNGKNVHAVTSPNGEDSYRMTIAGLMGFLDAQNVIYWT